MVFRSERQLFDGHIHRTRAQYSGAFNKPLTGLFPKGHIVEGNPFCVVAACVVGSAALTNIKCIRLVLDIPDNLFLFDLAVHHFKICTLQIT